MQALRATVAWSLCAGILWTLGACSPKAPGATARGVLVIAVDGLRFDHLGIHGYERSTSPALDALARDGVWFTNAYAAAPWQIPAHIGILSAADPTLARRVLPPGVPFSSSTVWHLPDEAPHPVVQFLSEGYATAAFYDHSNLAPLHGTTPGFELYQGPIEDDDEAHADFGSEAVFIRFSQWLAQLPASQPWFAYLELADLERVWGESDPRWDTFFPPRASMDSVPPVGEAQHLFFALPRRKWSEGISTLGDYEARYDGAIAQLDEAFKHLRTRLEQQGRFADTTIVVVGAYGMSFGESGLILDSGTFSDVDLHVPLIVRPARGIPARLGQPSEALVSTLDILPTLMEISQVPSAARMDGVSFARALAGEDRGSRQVVHASCAFQEGFAVLNKNFCFERTWPGRVLDPRLRESWFGDSLRRPDVMREVLHDRRRDATRGHLKLNSSEDAMARTLAEAGEAWAARVEARRAALQGEAPTPPDAAVGPAGGR